MHDERLDIYNKQMKWIGTAERSDVHSNGYWHKTFHCWIVSIVQDQVYLLFQKRHPSKDTFPNLLDKSAAGHYLQGEVEQDGLRELKEEIGVNVGWDELLPCGVVPIIHETPEFKDYEFCYVYLLFYQQRLDQYTLQEDEVTDLYHIELNDYRRLLSGQVDQILGLSAERETYFTLNDMTPQSAEYVNNLFKCLDVHINES